MVEMAVTEEMGPLKARYVNSINEKKIKSTPTTHSTAPFLRSHHFLCIVSPPAFFYFYQQFKFNQLISTEF